MPDGRILFLATILLAPAAWEGARELWRIRRTPLAFAVAAFVVIWAGYIATGAAYFFWYMVAPLAAWFALASMGLPRLVRGRSVYVSAALFVFGCWTVVWECTRGARGRILQTGANFATHAAPATRSCPRIGIIGYRAPVVVPGRGLRVSPQIRRRRRQGPGWMSDVVAAEVRRGSSRAVASRAP
jgi:hypothetical protein